MSTYLLFLFLIAFTGRITLSQHCVCSSCPHMSTVGEVYQDQCIYIQKYQVSDTSRSHKPVQQLADINQLHIFHNITRRFYKLFAVPRIALHLKSRSFVKDHIRLPSVPLASMRCPIYDIRTNILYDEYNSCIPRAQYSITSSYSGVKEVFHDKQLCDINYRCFRAKDIHTPCSMFSVKSYDDYKKVEQYALYNKEQLNRFLIKFDRVSVSLNQSDYFMHVSSINHYKEPFSCHYVDVKVGKIFQTTDCDSGDFPTDTKKLCYNDRKQKCPLLKPCTLFDWD